MHLLRRNLKLQPGLNSHPIIMMQFHIPFNRSISSTQVCMQVSKRPGLPPLFTTLDPRRLTSTNFRSIAGNISCRLRNKTTPEYKSSLIHYKRIGRIYVPFPEGTDGFFYYHSGPAYAPVAGELRFRVVPSANPDNFNTGHDLVQFHGGLPWSAPLPVLLQRPSYSALLPILKLDSPTLASIIELIDTKGMPLVDSDVKLIHSLGQPFYADLSKTRITYRVVQGSTIGKSRMFQLLADRRKAASGAVIGAPYTGSILCALERAPDDGAHPQCHIRVLDIIKPIALVDPEYDGHVRPPVKGELMQKGGGGLRVIRAPEFCALPNLETSSKKISRAVNKL